MIQLSELMGSKGVAKILRYLLDSPTAEVEQKELRKRAGLSQVTLSKALRLLEQSSIVHVRRIGVSKLYKLNRDNPAVKQLKILSTLLKLSPLKKEFDEGSKVFLYGSSARGEDVESSDIDILVISAVSLERLNRITARLSSMLGTSVRIAHYTPLEWADMAKKDPAFYERVEKDMIELSG